MPFTRQNPSAPIDPGKFRIKRQQTWRLGFVSVCAGLVLSGCGMFEEPTEEELLEQSFAREAVVTSDFEVTAPLNDLAFLSNPDAPWTGLIAGGLSNGGFDLFTIEGQRVMSSSGPRLEGLVGVAQFDLRGERFPFLFGVDTDGEMRSFAVVEQAGEIIELPLETGFETEWRSACYYSSGIGFVELALLGVGSEAAIVRIRDNGGAGLAVELRERVDLPFAARNCAVADNDLIVSGPTAGIARVSVNSRVLAEVSAVSVSELIYTELFGRPVAITLESGTPALLVYDAQTLNPIATLGTTGGLSTSGFQSPVTLTSTMDSYGGMAFSTGLIAGYDRSNGSVKLLARDVVSRAVLAPGDSTG